MRIHLSKKNDVVCWVLGCLVCCRLFILEIWKIFSRTHDRSDIHIILFRCKLTDSERHEDEWKSHENEIYSFFFVCAVWLRWNLRFPVDRKKAWCRIWWEESLRWRQQMAKLCASNWTLKFKVPSHLDWWWWQQHDHDQSQNKFLRLSHDPFIVSLVEWNGGERWRWSLSFPSSSSSLSTLLQACNDSNCNFTFAI